MHLGEEPKTTVCCSTVHPYQIQLLLASKGSGLLRCKPTRTKIHHPYLFPNTEKKFYTYTLGCIVHSRLV